MAHIALQNVIPKKANQAMDEDLEEGPVNLVQPDEADDKPDAAEDEPFLEAPDETDWKPPRGFLWIETAIFANVFLYGFDGTITAATYAVISSEFDAANTASWLTTSYLVTSTALQPLYGRFSDILGRRICFYVCTLTFGLGCLGCGLAPNILLVNLFRALSGCGGAGLNTMATIVNSDQIPFKRRGMYQALQNSMFGFGAICGASFGGAIADLVGWRWCFIAQVPVSVFALVLGYFFIENPASSLQVSGGLKMIWKKIDFTGSLVLVVALSVQLVALSLGGNDLPWDSPWVIASLVLSFALLALFLVVEAKTSAIPIIPLRQLSGRLPILVQISNICSGLSAYAFLFTLPLFFQVVLLDSATKAGARLAIPSLATPIGGIITGVIMSRVGGLLWLVRGGMVLMTFGNILVTTLGFSDPEWKYMVFIFPANLGQGIVYPAALFTILATFEHSDHAVSASTVYLLRSLGSVWGVSITGAILQTTLSKRLPEALSGIPDKEKAIDAIRHSVTAIVDLPPEVQLLARQVYHVGIRYSFVASTAIAALGVVTACFPRASAMRSTTK